MRVHIYWSWYSSPLYVSNRIQKQSTKTKSEIRSGLVNENKHYYRMIVHENIATKIIACWLDMRLNILSFNVRVFVIIISHRPPPFTCPSSRPINPPTHWPTYSPIQPPTAPHTTLQQQTRTLTHNHKHKTKCYCHPPINPLTNNISKRQAVCPPHQASNPHRPMTHISTQPPPSTQRNFVSGNLPGRQPAYLALMPTTLAQNTWLRTNQSQLQFTNGFKQTQPAHASHKPTPQWRMQY